MTEPRTRSGRALDAQFGAGQFGRVRDLAVAAENEARAALLDELEAAVRGLAGYLDTTPDEFTRLLRARLALIQQHRETT